MTNNISGLPKSRSEFKKLCLENLGSPVININVSTTQVENQINLALDWWHHNHTDGTELEYYIKDITQEDCDRGYLELTDDIIGIGRVIPTCRDFGFGGNSLVTFQYRLDLYDTLVNGSTEGTLTSFYLAKQYHNEIKRIFNAWPREEFTRYKGKLYILGEWMNRDGLQPEDKLCIEVYRKIDPITCPNMWSDYALIELATAMIQYQWGMNLSKYGNVTLPSGITLNGEAIKADGQAEIERVKEDIDNRWSPPSRFFIG